MYEVHLETIDSTQTYAKKHAASFPLHEVTCVTAEEQTAGRGRYQRKWHSPRGVNVYATFFFRLPAETPQLISLAQVMAYSFAKVLIEEGFTPKIKWPNDVQLSGKKVSGVLCETVFRGEVVEVFLGIGINVNLGAEEADAIDQPATSLKIASGRSWDRKVVLKKVQRQFEGDLERFKKEGFAPFHQPFENLLAMKGETVRCFDGKKEWVGICHSVSSDGQLNLYLPDRTMHTVLSGDLYRS